MSSSASSPQPRLDAVPWAREPRGAVVVGLDGSPTSWDAFWWAVGQARRVGHRIVAVFVSSPPNIYRGLSAVTGAIIDEGALHDAGEQDAAPIRQAALGYARELGLDLCFIHARGDAATELLTVAKKTLADLIVVGRSSKTAHQLVGSIGRRLIGNRHSPIVVVVP
jgi:nucleotide-binding universal stress UspA family protein